MKKLQFMMVFTLLLTLIVTPVSYAQGSMNYHLGVKASIAGHGTSKDMENKKQLFEFSSRSNKFFDMGMTDIIDEGDGEIYITASAEAKYKVDYLKMKIYLEKWNGSSWSTVKNWSKSTYNADSISTDVGYSGAKKDEKYRARTIYTMKENGITETEESTTSYIIMK